MRRIVGGNIRTDDITLCANWHFKYVGRTRNDEHFNEYETEVAYAPPTDYSGITFLIRGLDAMNKEKFKLLEEYCVPDLMRMELWEGHIPHPGDNDPQVWMTVYITYRDATKIVSMRSEEIARHKYDEWKGLLLMKTVCGEQVNLNDL